MIGREKDYQQYINEITVNGNRRIDNILMSVHPTSKHENHVEAQIDLAFQDGWAAKGVRTDPQVRALKGITDPAAFMRDVRTLIQGPITSEDLTDDMLFTMIDTHLKGKDHE